VINLLLKLDLQCLTLARINYCKLHVAILGIVIMQECSKILEDNEGILKYLLGNIVEWKRKVRKT
jgi:hypothetical protein